MISEIIARKPLVKKGNEIIVDLTAPSIQYDDPTVTIVDAFYVGEDMKGRIDLISMTAYGNVDDFDILMKYNGISNAFAIDYNDFILVPDLQEMKKVMTSDKDQEKDIDIRSQYTDPSKKSVVDPKKIEYDAMVKRLKETGKGINFSQFNLPPNISEPGQTEGLKNNGNVILGAFIGNQDRN